MALAFSYHCQVKHAQKNIENSQHFYTVTFIATYNEQHAFEIHMYVGKGWRREGHNQLGNGISGT